MYINFKKLLTEYLQKNPNLYSIEKQKILNITANAGMYLNFDSIEWSAYDLANWCKDYHNHKDFNNWQTCKIINGKTILLDGYKTTDWLALLSIPTIKEEIKILREQFSYDTLESKILKETIASKDTKELKNLFNLKKQTQDPNQEIFIYMKAPSIYDNEQINPIQTCKCGHEFLVQKIIPFEWENKNE